jgi:hypothetical protein
VARRGDEAMANLKDRLGCKGLGITLVAVGVALVVGAAMLGAFSFGAGPVATTHPDLGLPSSAVASNISNSTGPKVHSHAWGISAGPVTSTGKFDVAAGSDIFVFVGYINGIIGGGRITAVNDSAGNSYHLVATTGLVNNHTQTLYMAKDVAAASGVRVSATFGYGDTVQGGSVAAIDVVGTAGSHPIDVKKMFHGTKDFGYTALDTNATGNLYLIGVSGQAKIANVTAGYHERLLNTAGADAGPFEDGEGFGTMTTSGETGVFAVGFGMENAAVWSAIVVGIS